MFSLSKHGEVWTLHYEVSPLWRAICIGCGLAGMGFAIIEAATRSTGVPIWGIVLPALVVVAVMAYWVMSDAPTTVAFDLAQRRLNVRCERPWFGPPRTFAFADVAALRAVSRSGESSDAWEARLELRDGTAIRLGAEAEGRNERIRGFLDEIRRATGIGGA